MAKPQTTFKQRLNAGFRRFAQGFVLGPAAFWVSDLDSNGRLWVHIITKRAAFRVSVTPTGFVYIGDIENSEREDCRLSFEEACRRAETGEDDWPKALTNTQRKLCKTDTIAKIGEAKTVRRWAE